MMAFRPDLKVAAVGGLLVLSMAVGAVELFRPDHTAVVRITLAQGAIYAAAAFLIFRFARRAPAGTERATLVFILSTAVAMRALLVFAPPHSTDIYRYVWDGRVQASGTNPYIYIPADPALAPLRDAANIYPNINRKEYAPTIYPPMAQIVFFVASRFGETVTAMKLAMLLFDGIVVIALLKLLAARALSLSLVGLYAWHPLPIWEVAGSGHVDIIAVAFVMLAILAAERGNRFGAGAALAAGVLAKYFPLALTPAIYRRWDWKMPLAFAATAILLYLPYAQAGQKIFGFLGGYAGEELGAGEGLYIAALLNEAGLGSASIPVFLVLAAVTLFGLAWRSGFRINPEKPDIVGSLAIATAFTVFFSPHYPWYFIWLIPFLCFNPSPAVLWLTLSATALYRVGWPPSLFGASIQYVPFAILLIFENFKRVNPKEVTDGHRRFA